MRNVRKFFHYEIHLQLESFFKKKKPWGDFPGGSMVKNPPSNAGNTGSNQRSGTKIPQAMCHGQEIFFFLSLKLPLKKQLLVMVDTANCHFVL